MILIIPDDLEKTNLPEGGENHKLKGRMAEEIVKNNAAHLSKGDYYENYNSFYDLNMLLEEIQGMDIPENILNNIKNVDGGIDILTLGSATTNNISGLAKIDSHFRNENNIENDKVHIIDINKKSIDIHEKAINELNTLSERSGKIERDEAKKRGLIYPQYKVGLGDMRNLSYPDKSMTIAISDYTINYLDSIEDIKKTFSEVNRVLTPDGIFIMAIEYSKTSVLGQGDKESKEGNITINRFQLEEYIKAAEEANLEQVTLKDHPASGYGKATIAFKRKQKDTD